ncbi:N-acetylmuramoyl-L-alanine amidase [Corynebacterium sp. TAE3-ERU12]|uniref:N-acetylmuramoyl-L-alanine amidase n=1 Tax=Corynebacterium sp. TAE3-ERU12 TaxID=2849491 RepID=UPI001C482DD2|nr:N-acetylmuramoyl-L-alanine amidase [Corynebacterium sp. TAE3-ERU12]
MSKSPRVGDRSPRVAEVRAALARLGLLPSYAGNATQSSPQQWSGDDDLFDPELEQALRAFQQSRGIISDGVIREQTLHVLREASYKLGARVLNYDPLNPLTGDDVGQLQKTLEELGFYTHRIDGHYGPGTDQAVRDYQRNYALTVDGICGPDTLRALSYLGRRVTGGSAAYFHEREQVRQAGPKLSGKRVVIDPGLGADKPGMTVSGPYGALTEEEILWDLGTRVEGRMVAAGMETILSRPRTGNPSITERADLANAFGADLVLSLQADRYQNTRAHGCATFYFGSHHGSSSLVGEQLSGLIQREIVARTPLADCRTHARTWDVLRLTRMPTVEVALGYLTSPEDVAILTSPEMRDRIAEAILVGVKRLYLLDDDDRPTGTFSISELLQSEFDD